MSVFYSLHFNNLDKKYLGMNASLLLNSISFLLFLVVQIIHNVT